MHAIHSFDDDNGLNNIVSGCNELVQLSSQLVAKSEQYLKDFTVTIASGSGTDNTVLKSLYICNVHIIKMSL